jgi:hypothetical protein
MQSHTVPEKLLTQFAYYDPRTRSKRLWRYERGRRPHWKASPHTATRIDGHFTDPGDAAKEAELENRLNTEFEDPVNLFLADIGTPGFQLTESRRRLLTLYVTLLFLRSEARRKVSAHTQEIFEHALNLFLKNESQVLTVAVKLSIDRLLSGRRRDWIVTPADVIRGTRTRVEEISREIRVQQHYIATIEHSMLKIDEKLLRGSWNYLRTVPTDPFIISDAPVVTWERLPGGQFSFGLGVHRPNVEVLLPISPLVCLHIQPAVERTRQSLVPSVREVNIAQAAFAGRCCFSNIESEQIDQIVQENFGIAELGVKAFTIWHRNYETAIYETILNSGRWVEPRDRVAK